MSPRPRPRARAAAEGVAAARAAAARAATPTDWLRLHGIQAYGHLGVTQKERDLGQRVEADVEIAYAPEPRRRADSLDAYVDYEALNRLVRSQIEESRCRLLETLAEELAITILEEFETPRVRVRLRKLHVPVAGFTGIPEVEIERSRS
jgi:7,8-dihydroneopterin aldolase/epimerase/oxygenase